MDWVIAGGVALVLVLLGVLAQRRGWIDLTGRRAGRGGHAVGGVMGGVDEVFHPTRHEAQAELDRQSSLPAPAPIPGDGPTTDAYSGRVRIDLSDS